MAWGPLAGRAARVVRGMAAGGRHALRAEPTTPPPDAHPSGVPLTPLGGARLVAQPDWPLGAQAPAGHADLGIFAIAGRPVLCVVGEQGHPVASEGMGREYRAGPGDGARIAAFGPWKTLGDISHPEASPESIGHCWEAASSTGSGGFAGLTTSVGVVQRGTQVGMANGFHFCCRSQWPDDDYDATRMFIGLTDPTGQILEGDDRSLTRVGFRCDHVARGGVDPEWTIESHDGSSGQSASTGIPFRAGEHYEFHLWCWMVDEAGPAAWIGWQMFSGVGIASGTIDAHLPDGEVRLAVSQLLRAVENSTVRRIRGSWTLVAANV